MLKQKLRASDVGKLASAVKVPAGSLARSYVKVQAAPPSRVDIRIDHVVLTFIWFRSRLQTTDDLDRSLHKWLRHWAAIHHYVRCRSGHPYLLISVRLHLYEQRNMVQK